MEVILRVPPSVPLDQVCNFIIEAETAGFFGVAIPDSQLISRDTYLTLGLAAQCTSTIHLYAMVSNPVTRHVSVLASAMQTIDELAPGRLHVTLGTGAAAVAAVGRRPATVKTIAETIGTLKQLLSGEVVNFNESKSRLSYASDRQIPILVAGRGPRILEMAGEVADGVVPYVGLHPDNLTYARNLVVTGAERSGRTENPMEEVLDVHVGIAPTPTEARELSRPTCAYWASQPSLANLLRNAGLSVNIGDKVVTWAEAQQLAPSLSDDFVSQASNIIGAYGTPEDLADQLTCAEGRGISRIYVRPSEGDALPHKTLRAFQEVVFPALKNQGLNY